MIKYQLTKSSTSSGANFEVVQGCSTKADFSSKVSIALKEMRESPPKTEKFKLSFPRKWESIQ